MSQKYAVAVYTKSQCQPCRRTKIELDLRGVEYTEINIEVDEAARHYVMETLGHKQAPVVVVDQPVAPIHWSGLVPQLINEHFGPKPAKSAA